MSENHQIKLITDLVKHASTYKDERRIFDGFNKEVVINGHTMKVNKKLSTIKTDFEKAVREAGLRHSISNVTPHSARKFYCNSVYAFICSLPEIQIDVYLDTKKGKYESTFRKELAIINSKRKTPRNFDQLTGKLLSIKDFNDVLRFFTHEEKATLISSIESSHHRISIMAFYIDRKVKRKTQGGNTWGK